MKMILITRILIYLNFREAELPSTNVLPTWLAEWAARNKAAIETYKGEL
jgi:hypothetical protein